MMVRDKIEYEHLPAGMAMDETDYGLRYYLTELSDEHLMQYDPAWTDEEVIAWDDNFTEDGNLFLVCCERDIDIAEFRAVLEEHIEFRGLTK
ncbi:MAG: hypothetical protein HYV27_13785 [Candidatus Hydrogenedentes bacterium]|nr:hypothetical protein [Candidatus Hydrogenedentota bacterium]